MEVDFSFSLLRLNTNWLIDDNRVFGGVDSSYDLDHPTRRTSLNSLFDAFEGAFNGVNYKTSDGMFWVLHLNSL